MNILSTIFKNIIVVPLWCIIGCSTEPVVFPVDNVEGNCVGMVRDKAGLPVAGASLILLPEMYSPMSTVNGSMADSTTSDAYGRYGFTVKNPGAYNLLSKGNGLYAMRPIRIGTNARVILDNEILMAPGSLYGKVHLNSASDHRRAIILLMGTTVYTKPIDSTGVFSISALAGGLYTLRMLTAENDYVTAETTVTVISDMQTVLPCIELQKQFVPVIESLSVTYDPVMMRAVLNWPATDTSKVKNYVIYCNRSARNLQPAAMVVKSATSFTFDIIAQPFDTFLYEISAIKNDSIEGPSTPAKPLIKYSAIDVDTITSSVFFSPLQKFSFDRKDNMFTCSNNRIIKLDAKGNYLGDFDISKDTNEINGKINDNQLLIDTLGNVYTIVYSGSDRLLMKFNNDLQPIKKVPLDIAGNLSFAVSAEGAIMLFSASQNSSFSTIGTYKWIYDTQFNLIDKDSMSETLFINNSITSNDTTICLLIGGDLSVYRVVYFDHSFKQITASIDIDFFGNDSNGLSSSVPPEYQSRILRLNLVTKNLLMFQCFASTTSPCILLFIDDHLQPVARIPFNNYGMFFNSFSVSYNGNCFCVLNDNSTGLAPSLTDDNKKILKFSVDKMIKSNQLKGNEP
jgi:hypothetical protein